MPDTDSLKCLTVASWLHVITISMIECHVVNWAVNDPHFNLFSKDHGQLEFIPKYFGWEAGKYPEHLDNASGRTYSKTSQLPMGNLDCNSSDLGRGTK